MRTFESIEVHKESVEKNLDVAHNLGTDLVEASYHRCCCGECAKRRGRWFSISGNDKRFPKFESDYGCTCEGITFHPVFEFSKPIYCDPDMSIIEFSNRPFVDDRSEAEKELYEIERLLEKNESFWYEYDERWRERSKYDHNQYDLLKILFPDTSPKSFSGYMRMKHGNTKNYQTLVAEAKQYGVYLEYPEEIQKDFEYLKPLREIYVKTLTELNIRKRAASKKLHEENNNPPLSENK